MNEKLRFRAYIIFLNTKAYLNKKEIEEWLLENTKFCIPEYNLISICFFDITEAFVFLLKYYDYTQIQSLKEIVYLPPNFGHKNTISLHYPHSQL